MSATALTDLDNEVYDMLQRCREAGLPVNFCADGDTGKWGLIALLKQQLRAAADPIDGCDGTFYRIYPAE